MKPYALYYDGQFVGIITNPEPLGGMAGLCENLSEEDLAHSVAIPETHWKQIQQILESLGLENA